MEEKKSIDEYREAVRQCMLSATKDNGELQFTEKEVNARLALFSDDDLAFGMPFNIPEETANMLLSE